ncbi:MAG: glutathione S-transferase family protein [Gammaproteobacteria bacterium]|nr:MAG: glutathione S-transferase family protein [Gammaproteobacteria bacterium]
MELIGYEICPYVQRCIILLLVKGTPHRLTFIDLEHPPSWFRALSPLGQVPVLKVEDRALFDSGVINEYLDEAFPPRLHPEDPLPRAWHRSWIAFGTACLSSLAALYLAKEERDYLRARGDLLHKLRRLEQILEPLPFFGGKALSLVDVAYAPFFVRLELLQGRHAFYPEEHFPKISRWGKALLDLPQVQDSLVPDFSQRFFAHIRKKGPYAARLFSP